MKILSWNVRGLGQPRTVRRLKNKLRQIRPQILFLMEIKVTSRRTEVIRRQCGFINGIDVEAIGTRGGLSLGWKQGLNVILKSFSKSHIDVEVENEDEMVVWRFTGFYGEPIEHERRKSWDLLRLLKQEDSKPWLVPGDFNEILFSFEKKGGRICEERQMAEFRKALDYCELYDLGFNGLWYTWERGRLIDNNIRERLDRGVANTEWWSLFPTYKVTHLQHSFSDHCPVVMDTLGDNGIQRGVKQWHFCFNADWILNNEVEDRIQREWNSSNLNVLEKLKKVGTTLSTWAKKEKMEKDRRTEGLNKRLLELSDYEISDAVLEEIIEIKLELNFEADRDELFWEQRARVNWLRLGDRNTAFFHKSATYRRRKNMIRGLENEDGILISDEEEVSNMAIEYFKDLFSSKQVSNCDSLFDSFSPCIKDEHNVILMKEFKEKEVVKVIKSIAPLKASGQDSFLAIFYKKYWQIIGKEVTSFV
ncbi:hypothetical protein J1N35_038471 [Gossypium stocksii]|uniref:Endonuclease/exonuclease/phosphatase domain-containing protein n=1 Tax=Gossypium stocksii TaxID=47602 RepID=A0A9D3ZMT3_9ROSI|nr:hypothetical protein J1N35_038471 [Gossypium stocksii]